MSVSLYLGLPGDGKSMAGMRKVVDWLVNTDLGVVTNLPIEIGELEAYLFQAYGKHVDCLSRITLLGQEQVRKFWLVRPGGWRLVDLADADWSHNRFPSLQRVYRWRLESTMPRVPLEQQDEATVRSWLESGDLEVGDLGELRLGVLYVIDECQNFWPARSFQSTPKGLLFYLSQHRHAGDECVFITQKEGQVEKTIRNLVLEFWVYRNLGQRRRMGFKLPGIFGYACFDQPPSTPGAQFVGCGTFRMDVAGLANCYRTADGVGVGGPSMLADTKARRTGIPWQWVGVAFAVMLWLAYMAPGWINKGVALAFNRGKGALPGVATNLVVSAPLTNRAVLPTVLTVTQQVVASVAPVVRLEPVVLKLQTNRIAGAFWSSDGWWVQLTDGRRLGPSQYYFAEVEGKNLLRIQERRGAEFLDWR